MAIGTRPAPRRTRRTKPGTSSEWDEVTSLVPQDQTATQRHLETLIDAIDRCFIQKDKKTLVAIGAPFQFSVLRPDKEWRTHAFNGGSEFVLTGLRRSAKDELLFVFRAFEGDFVKAELKESKVFEAFPQLETDLTEALGQFYGPEFEEDFHAKNFAYVKDMLLKHIQFREVQEREEAEKRKAEEDALEALENPMWGMF